MVAEFDCPADAWFFKANSHDSLMPYVLFGRTNSVYHHCVLAW